MNTLYTNNIAADQPIRANACSVNTTVKGDTAMNTLNSTFANSRTNTSAAHAFARSARRAAALLAFGGLLALSHTPARADIVVERWVGPDGALGVPANVTALQLKVRNTYGYGVSGLRASALLFAPNLSDHTNPASDAFNLAPGEAKWVNVVIPAQGLRGTSLLNKTLSGMAWVTGGSGFSVSFFNKLPAPKVQAGNPTVISVNNGAKTFRLPFTNNGNAASQPQSVIVTTWLYADGQISPNYTQTQTIPALQPGQTVTLTFTTQPSQGYDIKGTIQVGGSTLSFSL